MSDFSLTLVLRLKTSKIINDVVKVQIKSEKITPFGGIFHVRELFSRFVGPVIDKVLGPRCTSYGYQYSEIVGSLSSVYFCGGDCVEDVTSHLMPHLSLHPSLRTCSSDTILRGISELATANTTYVSDTGKSYDFNTATKLNSLLVKALMNTGQLVAGESYDLDFDHQFIETEKYDAKMTYKKFTGYSPGVAVIDTLPNPLAIYCAAKLGLIGSTDYNSVTEEFGDIGSRQNYNKYRANPNLFTPQEIESTQSFLTSTP